MRIERIDDKTVKCYLSHEELAEYEITYKDFVTRTEKAKNMVEQIIAQAWKDLAKGKDVSIYGFIARGQALLCKIVPHGQVMKIWKKQQKLP